MTTLYAGNDFVLRTEVLQRTATKTANYTAAAGELVQFDLSGAGGNITLTLPATPTAGQQVGIQLLIGHATHNLIVALNSVAFRGGTSDIRYFDLCLAGDTLVLEYVDSTTGWVPVLDRIRTHRAKLRRDVASSAVLQVNAAAGALLMTFDTIEDQIGCAASLSTHSITPRRLGRYAATQHANAQAVSDRVRLTVTPAGPSNAKTYPDGTVSYGATVGIIAGGRQSLSVSAGTAVTAMAQLIENGGVAGTSHAFGIHCLFELEELRG